MRNPPPQPATGQSSMHFDRRRKLLIVLSSVGAAAVFTILILRCTKLLVTFAMPTTSMLPALSPGDHGLGEGLTFLFRRPRRGDVAVFESRGIPRLPTHTMHVKRIVGEPGDRLILGEGKLWINGKEVVMSNALGQIEYRVPGHMRQWMTWTDVTVPPGKYYVLGDNSTNSSDSRAWGFVPRENIVSRLVYCYWPPKRWGPIN